LREEAERGEGNSHHDFQNLRIFISMLGILLGTADEVRNLSLQVLLDEHEEMQSFAFLEDYIGTRTDRRNLFTERSCAPVVVLISDLSGLVLSAQAGDLDPSLHPWRGVLPLVPLQ
jgi:hypothetical protein